jgi:hypothetical protein
LLFWELSQFSKSIGVYVSMILCGSILNAAEALLGPQLAHCFEPH